MFQFAGSLGGLSLSTFPGVAQSSPSGQPTLGNDAMAIAAAAQQLVNMQQQITVTSPPQPSKRPVHKKKKLKSTHPPVILSKPVVTTPMSVPPPVSGVPSLAGISPYLLPTQGGVFYSPFLASQGLIATATSTAVASTATKTNSTTSSVDSNLRTETREEENSLDGINDGALGNFADDNDNTFAGVDLGDLDGELGVDVINEIAMEEDAME